MTRQTVCLANQWAVVRTPGRIELTPASAADARQIADASYDPDQERLQVIFQDGTTADASTQP